MGQVEGDCEAGRRDVCVSPEAVSFFSELNSTRLSWGLSASIFVHQEDRKQ